jgi:hypothetical protein
MTLFVLKALPPGEGLGGAFVILPASGESVGALVGLCGCKGPFRFVCSGGQCVGEAKGANLNSPWCCLALQGKGLVWQRSIGR